MYPASFAVVVVDVAVVVVLLVIISKGDDREKMVWNVVLTRLTHLPFFFNLKKILRLLHNKSNEDEVRHKSWKAMARHDTTQHSTTEHRTPQKK